MVPLIVAHAPCLALSRRRGGEWTLNWKDLTNLQYIDNSAFKNSSVQGCVTVSQPSSYVWIQRNAFQGCSGLTSVDINAGNLYVDEEAFFNCTAITEARFVANEEQDLSEGTFNRIGVNLFGGDSSITSITFGKQVPDMNFYGSGAGYVFTGLDNEDSLLKNAIHVPEGTERAYIDKWTYGLLGYSGYDEYCSRVESDLFWKCILRVLAKIRFVQSWQRTRLSPKTVCAI